MSFRIHAAALAVAAAFPSAVLAESASKALAPVIVTAGRVVQQDVDAPYASEVHGRSEIDNSGAVTLTEYLSRFTSVNAVPNFGNRFTPALDMRGYGTGDGYQNLVVTVNGRRLNNIDMVPQLLGAIPLGDVERIEITKGSGSVLFGDGAMAGTIQIETRQRSGVSVDAYAGSFGQQGLHASAGIGDERLSISASADSSVHDGYSRRDSTGHRDESQSDTWRMSFEARPVDVVKLSLDFGRSSIDTRYPGPLSVAQFKADPRQNNGSPYVQQDFKSEYVQAGTEVDFGNGLSLGATVSNEDKVSAFFNPAWSDPRSRSDSNYRGREVALKYVGDVAAISLGHQGFDGERKNSDSRTSKDSTAWFVSGQYYVGELTLAAGWRQEKVRYAYRPGSGGGRLVDGERLDAWEFGANYRVNDNWSIFANYNRAYQAPDIDRFFVTDFMTGDTSFNEFIAPAKVRTFNVGFNHTTPNNRLKVSAFHSRLRDEIYFSPIDGRNTNLDRSHKFGFEVQDVWRVHDGLTASVNYAWTRAIIDREAQASGAYDGKDLPGVPRHTLSAGLNYKLGARGNLNIAHVWRSEAWANDDFENSGSQKQRAYHSTDVSYRHSVSDSAVLFASVTNLFDRTNGQWVDTRGQSWNPDFVVYPLDFKRTWQVGASISF